MVGPVAIAVSLLAVFDDGGDDEINGLFERAVLLQDPKILLDTLSESQREAFMDRLWAWYSASRNLTEQRARKRVVQLFGPLQIYSDVTVDRMPLIVFDDGTDYDTLKFFWPNDVAIQLVMKNGVTGDDYQGTLTIEGDYGKLKRNGSFFRTVPLDDVETIIVL